MAYISFSNYRVNSFGFVSILRIDNWSCANKHLNQLASRFVPPEDLNAGLQDQTAALEFLQANLPQFGGDPSKVRLSFTYSLLPLT